MKNLTKENLQELTTLLNNNNVKSIFDELSNLVFHSEEFNIVALTLCEMVVENSKDFTKDVAEKGVMAEYYNQLSDKQAWCIAYQIKNNIEVYITALKEYSAFEEEKEIIEITAVSDGSTPNVTYKLDVALLKSKAVESQTFENPEKGTKNYPEYYMKKNAGLRIINNNGIFSLNQVSNNDSFFAVSKVFDLDCKKIELPYILGVRIKNYFKSASFC